MEVSLPCQVVVVGPMGVGKSTVAELLAARLDRAHRDGDRELEARTGRTGREIAEADGIERLHALEAQVLLDALGEADPLVISAAASTVDSEACRAALQPHLVVNLELGLDDLAARRATGRHRRALTPGEAIALDAHRARLFAEVADVTVAASQPPELVADQALAALGLPET